MQFADARAVLTHYALRATPEEFAKLKRFVDAAERLRADKRVANG